VPSATWCDAALRDALLDSGALRRTVEGDLQAPFHLRVAERLYLFSDYLGTHPDAVMGAGETTELLYQAALPQQPIDSLLDWGCGAGTLALLLARLTGQVTGTDINPRAIHLARWNAAVNRIANVEFRCGDGFAPVAGEQFECIVSQPPYYPCPADNTSSHVFLHGGPKGDEIARLLIDALPAHLAGSQARAFILASWPTQAVLPQPDSLCLLELYTAVGDVPGTRQSLAVFLQGAGRDCIEVPADCWGHVSRARIEQLLAAHHHARSPLPLPPLERLPGVTRFHEGQQAYLCFRPDSLLGITPATEAEWRCLTDPSTAAEPLRRSALAKGWLTISSSANRPSGDPA
jgi:SAM-dependent methyltransferase